MYLAIFSIPKISHDPTGTESDRLPIAQNSNSANSTGLRFQGVQALNSRKAHQATVLNKNCGGGGSNTLICTAWRLKF